MAYQRLFARLFPPPPLASVTDQTFDELRAKYRKRDLIGNVIGCLLFVGLGFLFYGLTVAAARLPDADFDAAVHLVRPSVYEYAVLAAFLSVSVVMPVCYLIIYFWFGRDEFRIYCAYGCYKSSRVPFDLLRVTKWMTALVFVPLVIFTLFYVDYYTAFTKDKILDNPLWSIGHVVEQNYTDIKAVYEIERVKPLIGNGQGKIQPYYLIVFLDGTRWMSEEGHNQFKIAANQRVIQFVLQQSQAKLRAVKFIDDVP